MQVRAIVEAMISCRKKKVMAKPEIMIPLIGTKTELDMLRKQVEETIAQTKRDKKFSGRLDIPIGTMIEIPRAAVTADEVAEVADFFSFGTNDLTQLTFGYSRDDINGFLPDYLETNISPQGSLPEHRCRRRRGAGGSCGRCGSAHPAGYQARCLR